jgi:hypothetical protein
MRVLMLSTLAGVILPGWCWGEVNHSWEELMQKLEPGQSVVVTRMNSANLAGRVEQITAEGVTVNWQGGTKVVPKGEVYRVKTENRRARRAVIGAVAAGGGCLLVTGLLAAKVFTDASESVSWGGPLGFSAICAGAGAGLGAATTGQKTLYEATAPLRQATEAGDTAR